MEASGDHPATQLNHAERHCKSGPTQDLVAAKKLRGQLRRGFKGKNEKEKEGHFGKVAFNNRIDGLQLLTRCNNDLCDKTADPLAHVYTQSLPRSLVRFKVCESCKCVQYCSPECQMADWKAGHKRDCNGASLT